jgi:hypothetical protein
MDIDRRLLKEKFQEFLRWDVEKRKTPLTKWDIYFSIILFVLLIIIIAVFGFIGVKYFGWTIS